MMYQYSFFACSKISVSCSVMPDSLQPHGLQPTRRLCPRDFPGKDTGLGCRFLLQGIFPIQGSNSRLLHCRQILYQPSCKGSPGPTALDGDSGGDCAQVGASRSSLYFLLSFAVNLKLLLKIKLFFFTNVHFKILSTEYD